MNEATRTALKMALNAQQNYREMYAEDVERHQQNLDGATKSLNEAESTIEAIKADLIKN